MRKRIVLVLCFVLVPMAAMAGPSATRTAGSVQIELTLDKSSYAPGEAIAITLGVSNQGPGPVSFEFSSSQMYDFFVLRDGQRIWQWSHGRAFIQVFGTLTLKPGESKTFQERWDRRDSQNQQVPAGEYEMVAVFLARSPRLDGLDGPRVRFVIASPSALPPPGPQRSVISRAVTLSGHPIGEVLVDGRPVLRIRVSAGGLSPFARAQMVAARLQRLLAAGLTPRELTVVPVGGEAAVMRRGQLVITADGAQARLNRTTPLALARAWMRALVVALSSNP